MTNNTPRSRRGTLLLPCAALAVALLAAGPANASTILFNDLTSSPFITVTGADASRVIVGANPCVSDGSGGETCTVFVSTPAAYVQGAGVGIQGNANIFETGSGILISDTYLETPTFVNGLLIGFSLTFRSNDVQPLAPNARSINEDGTVQSLDQLQWSNGTSIIAVDQINFASTDAVPEPATMSLIGFSCLAFGLIRRRNSTR